MKNKSLMKILFLLSIVSYGSVSAIPITGSHLLAKKYAHPSPGGGCATTTQATPQDIRYDLVREEVYLNEDQTYTLTYTQEITLLTPASLTKNQSTTSPSYYPKYQSVKLLEAYIIHPDGTKVIVPAENVFTTSVPADPNAPGFDVGLQQSIAFPQIKLGSKLHVRWEYKQLTPPVFNFADVSSPSDKYNSIHTEMSVNVPEGMYVRWAKRGPYEMKEVHENGRHIISAVIGPQMAITPEPFMQATSDFLPFFEVTTVKTWQEVGTKTWNQVQASQQVTPEIKEFVLKLVGDKTGYDAAKILYDWVASNIMYLEVMLDPRMGYVPTPASQAMYDRYTDCKGHASLLQTFLKVIGIESYPVLVNWDNSLEQYPLPINSFDHEMLYIPEFKIVSNPTNNYNPFGAPLEETNYSSKTSGFQVLADKPILICQPNEQGPGLIKTPQATPEENQYHMVSEMQLDLDGNLKANGTISGSGNPDSTIRGYLSLGSVSNVMTDVLSSNGIVNKVTAQGTLANDLSQPVKIMYNWQASSVAQSAGENWIFKVPIGPDFFPAQFFVQFLNTTGTRNFPIIVGAGLFDWSHTLQMPPGYEVKKFPKAIDLKNSAGSYISKYVIDNNKLKISRTLTIKKNVYAPTEYAALYDLLFTAYQDAQVTINLTPIPVPFPGIPENKVTMEERTNYF